MDLYLRQSDDRVRVWTYLTVGFFKSDNLVEGYGFVEIATGETWICTLVRHELTPYFIYIIEGWCRVGGFAGGPQSGIGHGPGQSTDTPAG